MAQEKCTHTLIYQQSFGGGGWRRGAWTRIPKTKGGGGGGGENTDCKFLMS